MNSDRLNYPHLIKGGEFSQEFTFNGLTGAACYPQVLPKPHFSAACALIVLRFSRAGISRFMDDLIKLSGH